MKLRHMLLSALVMFSMATGSAFAADADKAKKQAEIKKVAAAALADFYKAEPKLKAEVAGAPGYAVFSTYGISFVIGGSGGKGLVHNNKTKKDTFMHQAQASVGLQAGIAENRTLIVFASAESMNQFIEKGWDAKVGGSAGGAVEGKGASGGAGGSIISGAKTYTLTQTGLQAGVALAGAKFWKDKDLN